MQTGSSKPEGSLSVQLSEAICASDPGTEPIGKAREALLDFFAASLAGIDDDGARKLWAVVGHEGGNPRCSIFGQDARAPASVAAFVNAYIAHALDYDDGHRSIRGHPSAVILPPLFALAEDRDLSCEAILRAYVVGVETMARLGLAFGTAAYERGLHYTSFLGGVAAAAASGYILKLDPTQMASALGQGANQACGLRVQFGTEIKPLNAGLAARAGLQAALFAEQGLSGSAEAFDGKLGFPEVFSAENPSAIYESWGADWQICSPGLQFKSYACCGGNHYAADAMISLRDAHGLRPDDVEDIEVVFPPGGDDALIERNPSTGMQGRFSIEYVVAAILEGENLGPRSFTDVPVTESRRRLMARVRRRIDSAAPRVRNLATTRFSTVNVHLRSGEVLSKTVAGKAKGPGNLRNKLLEVTGESAAGARLAHLLENFSTRDHFREVMSLTRSWPAP